MAYLDLSGFSGQATASATLADVASLTHLEWQVVALARRDRLSSLERPSRWARFLALFFGGDRANPGLADSKLEALRRIAVLAWRNGPALPQAEVHAFHAAGYSPNHLALVIDRISHALRG